MEINKERVAQLVVEIQKGNQSAFNELYEITSKRAFFVAKEFVKNEADAEDILQESYIKALSRINELDKPESFSSWLNQIVANKSKDFIKKKKPTLFEADENEAFEVIPDEDTEFSPEGNLDQNELERTVKEVLDELNEEKKACVLMMYYEELSVSEIAQTLEIPEGTVKTRLFSARKDLKEKFARRGITSAFSVAPVGVVVWALNRTSIRTGTAYAASAGSAKVLAGVTASGALAGTAAIGTGAAVAGAGVAAVSTGGGIAAKIAAFTVAQKVIAGVSAAVVVAGTTVGAVTVAKNIQQKRAEDTTGHTEEYTTAPSRETTVWVQAADGTVEFTLTDLSSTVSDTVTASVSDGQVQSTQTVSGGQTTGTQRSTSAARSTTVRASAMAKPTTTKPTTRATTKPTTTKPTTRATTKPTTTKPTTRATTKPTTTKPTTRATTKPTSTKPTTSKQVSTTKATVTIDVDVYSADTGEFITTLSHEATVGKPVSTSDVDQTIQNNKSKLGSYYNDGVITYNEGVPIASVQPNIAYKISAEVS